MFPPKSVYERKQLGEGLAAKSPSIAGRVYPIKISGVVRAGLDTFLPTFVANTKFMFV